jgi:predicted Zn-dependent protease
MSASESRSEPAIQLAKVQNLYDRHQYLDAYNLTSELWQDSTDVQRLSTDELILAGRLAARLGGLRLSRWLLREVLKRDPLNPRVRYFARYVRSSRLRLLDELKTFNARPDLGGDDPELRASWYASYGFTWATLRDFDRAYECFALAHSLAPNDSWVLSCESDALGMADRWSESLASAERAWDADPGSPFAANSLGTSLLHLGRVHESADRLHIAAENSQSYQLVAEACWHQCALAETLEGQQRRHLLERARSLAEELPSLAPLADRDAKTTFARAQLDIAELADDHAEIERWSTQLRSPFHRQLLRNLNKNAAGKRIRLPFRRTIQTHETCVPASVAVALSAGGVVISTEEMAADITFGGTPEWAAADWLRARGFHVRFFSVTPELAAELIQHQIAFMISWEADASGHAVAAIGLDQRAETLLIHDPQSFRGIEYLLTILDRNVTPLGIKGMAVVTKDRAADLDAVLPPESALMEAAQEHQKVMALQGPASARKIAAGIAKLFPSHPGALYLQSVQDLDDGHVGQALQGFQELLRQFPNSPTVRVRFMSACRALGNSDLVRKTLKNIVERGVLPGLESQQEWIYPPDRYVFEYADLLRLSAQTSDQAESLLHHLIRRQCSSAGAWHNLGDLLWQKRDMEGTLLCYRIASCLANSDEHYARAYADGLADEKRGEEGFRWLEGRVRRFGSSPHAVATWISWIGTLEDRGYPERALTACKEALAQHSDSPELLSFAVPFFARMGDWEGAERNLSQLKSRDNPAAFYEASVHFFRMRGDLKTAAVNAAAWIRELPRSMHARHAMLDLIAMQEGPDSAVETAARWMHENEDHEEFEEAYCLQLDNAAGPKGKKFSVLLRRLKRNREDAWAWREATFCILYQYDLADGRQQKRLERRIPEFLAECDRTSNEHVATIRAHALWSECRGDWSGAIAKSLEGIDLDPRGFYSYRRIWECSARLDNFERNRLWKQIEPMLLNSPGHLSIAREVMGLLAERFGVLQAEETIKTWMAARPGDPNVIEAAADLLIDRGHGRSDASRAIAMLKPAVERYPHHSGLRFSLANAYRRAGQDSEAEGVLSEIVRRHPDNSAAMIQLAWIRHRHGDQEDAYRILDTAAAASPRNPEILDTRVQILIENHRLDDACQSIEHGLHYMPENVHWRSRAIPLLSQCGAEATAIQAARAGVRVYPRGGYLWLLLGRTLNEMRQFAEVGEIESCLRRSLRINGILFEAADLLSILLTEQRRYDEAAGVMREIEKRMSDPCPALGRLAWIKRIQGQLGDALDDLAKVVTASPWYSWGWNLLISWLGEDQQWGQTRQLLQDIPSQMFTNTSFRLQRLLLLEKAGVDRARLDTEWDDLLRDFPENVTLFVKRYDNLHESERFDAAASVLESILQFDPDNPFILARRVEVLSRAADNDAALEVALRACFSPLEESPWPADKIWDVALTGGFADQLYKKAVQGLSSGKKPTRRSFARMIAHPMRIETKRGLQPRTTTWLLFGGAKELARLERLVSNAGWDGSSYRAELYRELCDYGYHRIVRRFWKKNGGTALNIDEWSQIGRSLVGARLHSEGRRFLGAWRERPGVGMWMVANYTLCLSRFRRSQLEELRAACQDALCGLPHDDCASFLAHVLAEACALLGDKEAFLQTWNTYSTYFGTELKKNEYFQPRRRHLLGDVPMMARYLQQNETRLYRKMLWKLRWGSVPSAQTRSGAEREPFANVPWWVWWLLFMLVLQLFRNPQ